MFDIRNLIRMNDFTNFFLFSCAFVLLRYAQICNKLPFSVTMRPHSMKQLCMVTELKRDDN